MGDDELFQVKNHFYLGAYQQAINEATQSSFSDATRVELDCLQERVLGSVHPSLLRKLVAEFIPEDWIVMRLSWEGPERERERSPDKNE